MTSVKFVPVGCLVGTISDTRTKDTDSSGLLICDKLRNMGHSVVDYQIIPDDTEAIQTLVIGAQNRADIRIVILTGGTGITDRDVTPDAVADISTKYIPGFGELFRWLSFNDIGASTIQSRAGAWLCKDTLVFCLPGSTSAVRMAMDQILVEQLDRRTKPCNFIQLLPRIGQTS